MPRRLARDARKSAGLRVIGAERHSITSERDNPISASDRSSIVRSGLIADRINNAAINTDIWFAALAAQFLIMIVSIG